MTQLKNPSWWTSEDDSAWERTKAAFKRDWDQTKHDFGGNEPDTKQNIKGTVKQAVGKELIAPRGVISFDQAEPAYRFGYGARAHYGRVHRTWNEHVEDELRREWDSIHPERNWDKDAEYIQHGWDYEG